MEVAATAARRPRPRPSPATSSRSGGRRSPFPFSPTSVRPRRRPPPCAEATNPGVGRPAAPAPAPRSQSRPRPRERSPWPSCGSLPVEATDPRDQPPASPPGLVYRDVFQPQPSARTRPRSPLPGPAPPVPAATSSAARRASAPSSDMTRRLPSKALRVAAPREAGERPPASPCSRGRSFVIRIRIQVHKSVVFNLFITSKLEKGDTYT